MVTSELRKKAKAVNFGIIYGISDFSLAGDIHVSRKEAGDYIRSYFARYPKVKEYLDNAIASAREKAIPKRYTHAAGIFRSLRQKTKTCRTSANALP